MIGTISPLQTHVTVTGSYSGITRPKVIVIQSPQHEIFQSHFYTTRTISTELRILTPTPYPSQIQQMMRIGKPLCLSGCSYTVKKLHKIQMTNQLSNNYIIFTALNLLWCSPLAAGLDPLSEGIYSIGTAPVS